VKAISGKDFAKLLERKGWVLRRVNGSHHIYNKEGNPARISAGSSQRTAEGRVAKAPHENRRD
jgi:predicted RNA binding protein YcfA (HicA-like mRNA interferase family)